MTHSQPIRIGVLGTHSTGKTTLVKRIEMELRGHGLTVAHTVGSASGRRRPGCRRCSHTERSTEWIITQGIANEISAVTLGAEVVLADRASYDALAYWHAALECRGETVPRLERERLLALAATQLP
ncbi:AAA family ATPase [Streptomyces sp. NBC_01017]|uniref:AAA family ATPase n=1 Tax=Streptomyces sp. NBC_01017 TaxID=2903721 RepID=UPI003868EA45|nr:AAA family ATPase [Streptomyces sp. NBC_01017]WSV35181.1 AAA family ATPase [Streptomyces sp. NBC_01017]